MQSGITDDGRASFGQFLISSRTRAGISLEEIAAATKVSARYLQALERGRVEVLPGGVYRRSIVRGYAAAIGLDPDIALDWFDRTFGDEAAPPFRLETPENPTTQPMIRFAPSRAVLAAAAIVMTAAVIGPLALSDEDERSRERRRDLMTGAAAAPIRSAVPAVPTAAPETSTDSRAADQSRVPSAPRRRARVRPGLVVTSRPAGARVTVNGIGWGVTPLTVPYLPPGDKIVRVTKDGYLARQLTVHVSTEGSAAVRATLRPRVENGSPAPF